MPDNKPLEPYRNAINVVIKHYKKQFQISQSVENKIELLYDCITKIDELLNAEG